MFEQTGFVIRVLPVDLQKGQLAEIILQTSQGPIAIKTKIPHIIAAKNKSERIENIQKCLGSYPFSELDLALYRKPYARSAKEDVLQVFGGRDKLKDVVRRLRNQGLAEISVKKYLRWHANYPFANMFDSKFTGEHATLNELLSFGDAALDIETNKAVEKEEELGNSNLEYSEINTATFAWQSSGAVGAEAITTLNPGMPVVDAAGLQVPIHLVPKGSVAGTLDDIIRRARIEQNTLFLHTYNGMTYDLLKLRDLEEFFPAQDGEEPKITAHVSDFSRRVEIKDFIVLDYLAFARNYFSYLPIKKLERFCRFLCIKFEKDIGGYAGLDRNVFAAQHGDRQAAERVIKYNAADTAILLEIAKKLKHVVLQIAMQLGASPEAVCATSKKTNSSDFWDRRYFIETNMLPTKAFAQKDFKDFDVTDEKTKLFWRNRAFSNIKKGLRHGSFYIVQLNTIIPSFYLAGSVRLAQATKNSAGLERLCYLQALESICEKPLFDLFHGCPDKVFYAKYSQEKSDVREKLQNNSAAAWQFLVSNGLRIVNYSNNMLILEGDAAGLEDEISNSGLFAPIGTAQTALSIDEGRFLTHINGCIVGSGFDPSGRRGETTLLEKDAIPEIIHSIVVQGDYKSALNYLYEKIWRPMSAKAIDRGQLLFQKKIYRKASQIAITAQKRRSVVAQQALGASIGETMQWGYAIKNKKQKIVSAEEFLNLKTEVDWNYYYGQFFGKEAKIMQIVDAIKGDYDSGDRQIVAKLKTIPQPVTLTTF